MEVELLIVEEFPIAGLPAPILLPLYADCQRDYILEPVIVVAARLFDLQKSKPYVF